MRMLQPYSSPDFSLEIQTSGTSNLTCPNHSLPSLFPNPFYTVKGTRQPFTIRPKTRASFLILPNRSNQTWVRTVCNQAHWSSRLNLSVKPWAHPLPLLTSLTPTAFQLPPLHPPDSAARLILLKHKPECIYFSVSLQPCSSSDTTAVAPKPHWISFPYSLIQGPAHLNQQKLTLLHMPTVLSSSGKVFVNAWIVFVVPETWPYSILFFLHGHNILHLCISLSPLPDKSLCEKSGLYRCIISLSGPMISSM